MRAGDRPFEVDGDQPSPARRRRVGEPGEVVEARVADEDVEGGPPREGIGDGGRLGEIDDERETSELSRERLGRGGAAIEDHDLASFRGDPPRGRLTDSAGASGDQCPAAVEAAHRPV